MICILSNHSYPCLPLPTLPCYPLPLPPMLAPPLTPEVMKLPETTGDYQRPEETIGD